MFSARLKEPEEVVAVDLVSWAHRANRLVCGCRDVENAELADRAIHRKEHGAGRQPLGARCCEAGISNRLVSGSHDSVGEVANLHPWNLASVVRGVLPARRAAAGCLNHVAE